MQRKRKERQWDLEKAPFFYFLVALPIEHPTDRYQTTRYLYDTIKVRASHPGQSQDDVWHALAIDTKVAQHLLDIFHKEQKEGGDYEGYESTWDPFPNEAQSWIYCDFRKRKMDKQKRQWMESTLEPEQFQGKMDCLEKDFTEFPNPYDDPTSKIRLEMAEEEEVSKAK